MLQPCSFSHPGDMIRPLTATTLAFLALPPVEPPAKIFRTLHPLCALLLHVAHWQLGFSTKAAHIGSYKAVSSPGTRDLLPAKSETENTLPMHTSCESLSRLTNSRLEKHAAAHLQARLLAPAQRPCFQRAFQIQPRTAARLEGATFDFHEGSAKELPLDPRERKAPAA